MDTPHGPRQSFLDGVPPKTALGIGAALGVGALGVVGFLVLLPGAIKGQDAAPAPTNAAPVAPAPAPTPVAPPAPPPGPVNITVSDDDNIRGPKDAKVTIVEWSDFQCPFCSRFHPSLVQALAEYPKDVRWIYRHFPLESIHPNARPSAEASECAAEQDKFWEFADAMFAGQEKLGTAFYEETAGKLGLKLNQFKSCVSSRKYEAKVRAQESAGLAVGVRGTPGSFVNGIELGGAVPYAQVKALIEQALQQ